MVESDEEAAAGGLVAVLTASRPVVAAFEVTTIAGLDVRLADEMAEFVVTLEADERLRMCEAELESEDVDESAIGGATIIVVGVVS